MIIYQMLFAFFYELGAGQWPASFDADAHKGVAGVSLLEAIFALSISNLIEANVGYKLVLSRWFIWIFVVGLIVLNYYFLVSLKLGLRFIPELAHYPRRKRAIFNGMAFGVVLAVGILFLYSVRVFHHAFMR